MSQHSIWLIILLALLLRLPLLNGSFWLDEAAQALESIRPFSQQLDIANDFQPPLYHVFVHVVSLVSHAEWWLRLASLVPGLITIYLVYKIGCQLSGYRVGLLAALLLATSQFHLFYSQELRPYSLATMFGVLSMYYFLKLLRNSRNIRHTAYYILFTVLGMYSVYTFPFLLLAQLMYILLFHREVLKRWTMHLVPCTVFCLPWLPSFLVQLKTGLATTVALPLWKTAVSPPVVKALLLVPPKFIFGRLDLPNSWLALIPLLGVLVGISYIIWSTRHVKYFRLLVVWLMVPVLLGFLVSFRVPVLDPKRFLFCLPPLYLLIASAKTKWKYALIPLNVLTIIFYWVNPNFQREPWRQAIQTISAQITPTTTLIFPWHGPYAPWEWYTAMQPKTLGFTSLPATKPIVDQALASLTQTDQIIYFDYLEDITDPQGLIRADLNARGWSQVDFWQYPGIGKIRRYSRTPVYALQ